MCKSFLLLEARRSKPEMLRVSTTREVLRNWLPDFDCTRQQSLPRPTASTTTRPVFTGINALLYWLVAAVWSILTLRFWYWWLDVEHIQSLPTFILVTAVLVWATLLPAYFIIIFGRAVVPVYQHVTGRIAMVVTKAPSEPFDILKKTLLAMLSQEGWKGGEEFGHDTWLADEQPSRETLDWCKAHGVFVSTRHDISAYHRVEWPRRTRCKEGNLAYFYDHFGYDNYDFVSQLDADHVPCPTYLREIIAPFADPAIGYVSAPSLCDANAATSWAARGRLHVEASMHGALQAGYSAGLAPLCIGSHYAVRTAALKSIGGLGPELAEDHSTSLMMNAFGWRGMHAINATAHGDGPVTFADLATQEFQWSRSVVTILLTWSPTYVPMLPWLLRLQFLFSQLWYPLFSAVMAMGFILPILALITGVPLVAVQYPAFLAHFLPSAIWLLLAAFWWRSFGNFRPAGAQILSLDGAVFLFARWPWSLAGCIMAIWDRISGQFVDFRITPKGSRKGRLLPMRVIVPYAALSIASGVIALRTEATDAVWGYYMFAALNALIYAFVLLWIVAKHILESNFDRLVFANAAPTLTFALGLFVLPGAIMTLHGLQAIHALSHGISGVQPTKITFAVAGAGSGRAGLKTVSFSDEWIEQFFGRSTGRVSGVQGG